MKQGIQVVIAALIFACPSGAIAKSPPLPKERFGDWNIAFLANGSAIASTQNSGGAVFGSICDRSGCVAFFNPAVKCQVGEKYPALINAPSSAFPVTMECEKVGELFVYSLPIEGYIADAMSVGGVLGFAFPMESGEFKVARFSLTGAARATARASQQAKARPADSAPKGDNYSL